MQRLNFLSLLLCLTTFGNAQIIKTKVSGFIIEQGIDTFLVYSYACSGYIIPNDSCYLEEPHFLMWTQKGKYYLKKFNNCNTFKNILIDPNNPLAYYLKNRHIIDTQEIRQPTYYKIRKTKNNLDTITTILDVSHPCFHTYHFSFFKNENIKYANSYYLDFKTFGNEENNVYYVYNQKSKFKNLIELTNELIRSLETNRKFEIE